MKIPELYRILQNFHPQKSQQNHKINTSMQEKQQVALTFPKLQIDGKKKPPKWKKNFQMC